MGSGRRPEATVQSASFLPYGNMENTQSAILAVAHSAAATSIRRMDGPASKVIVAWHMVLLRHVPSPATLPLTRADTPLQLTASLACSCQRCKPREACSGVWLGAWHELTALACRSSQESSVASGKCHSRACHFGGVSAYPYKRAHHELSITLSIEVLCSHAALRSRLHLYQ